MIPYRDFPFEYPVLSFPLFLLPRLLVSDLDGYKAAFVVEMLLFDAAAIYLIARQVSESEGMEQVPWRLGWYTLYCAILSPLVIGRFELAPMVLAFAAARWWYAGRSPLGGMTAGLGAARKSSPGWSPLRRWSGSYRGCGRLGRAAWRLSSRPWPSGWPPGSP